MDTFASGRNCRILRHIDVPMRDGVKLATSIYLPAAGDAFPVVLVRTAYNRVGVFDPFFLDHGMALVAQDCRGRYASEGEYDPFVNEAEDGFDTQEWIGRQPWCNGKIGMFGDSYLAATQFLSAPLGSRFLAALNPRFMAGDCWKRAYYVDGAFSLALTWSWLCFETQARSSEAALMPHFNVPALLRTLPIMAMDEASGAGQARFYREYVRHNRYDAHWEALNVRSRLHRFRVPVLLTGGWYDNYAAETTSNFTRLCQGCADGQLRDSHRMIIGPWTHGINYSTVLGELDYGPAALRENDATQRWLDHLLHGRGAKAFQQAPIRIFVMGLNAWRDEYEWPLARTQYRNFYLEAGGGLVPAAPSAPEAFTGYDYDPDDPVPTLGGNHSVGPYNPGLYDFVKPGPYDQRAVETRADVRVFTSTELTRDVEVTGPVVVKLYAASSAPDTDFVAKLTDVYPDGRSMNITEGVIRARFREDVWGPPRLMDPNRVYEFTIDLQVTSNVFRQGHRIRLDLTSSNFPLWDRNLNTGEDPGTGTRMRVAHQKIYHDRSRPSHIVLPIVGECEWRNPAGQPGSAV